MASLQGRRKLARSAQRCAAPADDKVEETVWEYKAVILDRDKKPRGPNTWVSKATSLVRVEDTDSDAQYEACEFGNRSSHDIAFRITKASGLQFSPDHGVLKPNEKVPLKFKLRPGVRQQPELAEVDILAMRVNPATNSRVIEDKWRTVPANKVSRVRHTVQLRAPENTRRRTSLPSSPTSYTVPLEWTPRHAAAEEDDGRPGRPGSAAATGRPESRRPPPGVPSRDFFADTAVVAPRQKVKGSSSACSKLLHVAVILLALAVVCLIVQVRSLWDRVNNIGESFCERHFCIWFYCR